MNDQLIKINYIAWVQEGFQLFSQNWIKWCQVSFFALGLQLFPLILGAMIDRWINHSWFSFINQGGIFLWVFVVGPLMHSLYRITILQDEEGDFEVQDVHYGFKERYWEFTKFWLFAYFIVLGLAFAGEMLISKLDMQGKDIIIFLILFALVLCVLAVKILFLFPLMVDQGLSWQDGFAQSNHMVKRKFGGFLLFFLLLQFLQSLGFYACYVGYVVSYPLVFTITYVAYKALFLGEPGNKIEESE